MASSLLLTMVGPDRPGLVERVAGIIAAHDGNWLESRLAHLGGHFAGVVRVEVPADRHSALRAEFERLAEEDLTVTVTAAAAVASSTARAVRLEVVGLDRPRIVSEIASVIALRGLNVEEFSSEVTSAPMTAEPLFVARMRLAVPAAADVGALRADLEKIAGQLMVEVSLDDGAG